MPELNLPYVYFTGQMSRIVRKPDFCLCENKGADQLRSNCEADQRLCFRYSDSTISLLPKSEISSFLPFSETAQTGLCRTWSETPKTGFLASRLINGSRNTYTCILSPRGATNLDPVDIIGWLWVCRISLNIATY